MPRGMRRNNVIGIVLPHCNIYACLGGDAIEKSTYFKRLSEQRFRCIAAYKGSFEALAQLGTQTA